MKTVGKRLDIIWAKIIKSLGGNKCEYCGKETYLNSHHIYSRSKASTRWSLDNGICLCVGCHTFSSKFSAHKTPLDFHKWLISYRGQEYVDRLMVAANTHLKLNNNDKEEILIELTNILEMIEL